MDRIDVRKGMPDPSLSREEFEHRFRKRFFDPAFTTHYAAITALADVAWDAYLDSRKSPRTQKAGPGFFNPDYEASVEWLDARAKVEAAESRQKDRASPNRILLVNGSMRSDQTCPGEISKSWRLMRMAEEEIAAQQDFEVDVLDLSLLASQYGRVIHPCKSCVSTAMPLCHWPCSCYPNHALGQSVDWMNEIYPMWVAAHGIMIVTPVNWYQAPSGLKAMIDRLVCADGGNPDLTTTDGKDPELAKKMELAGWDYPRHLAGRVFSVVVHGDATGVETLRRILTDWLSDMGLIAAGQKGQLQAYIGYLGSYAESHAALDADDAVQSDTRTAAKALAEAVRRMRDGALTPPDQGLKEARPK